jgi:hypothetical protein
MLHFKIVGAMWAVLCLVAAAVFAPQLWSMVMDRQYGIARGFNDEGLWISQFFAELFLLACAMLGFGLFRLRRWAAIFIRITANVLLLYSLSFVLMSHFHAAWLLRPTVCLLFGDLDRMTMLPRSVSGFSLASDICG